MKSIYLIHSDPDNTYKIGVSGKVKQRLKGLQTANSSELRIVKTFETKYNKKVETALHKYFGTNKIRGEWFSLTKEQVAEFDERCKLYERNFDSLKAFHNPFLQLD